MTVSAAAWAGIIAAVEAMAVVEGLAGFDDRGAGTDAERRAAGWLAGELATAGRDVAVETFWCRPNWALAHAWHAALGVTGSLVSLASPAAGVAILTLALASVFADWLTGVSLGRRLTREHASQNVTALTADTSKRVRLIITANYDAGRTGFAYRDWLRRPAGALRHGLSGLTPGWLGWFSLALVWLLAIAILRLTGHPAHSLGTAQLPPTAALVLAFAVLVDLGSGAWSPAAGDNATGAAVAVAVVAALGAMPPRHVDVELVLSGAGDGSQLGLRHHLRRARGERRRSDTVVLGIAPCAAGRPRWWSGDGSLIPLGYARTLRSLAQEIAIDEPHLQLSAHTGRGRGPAEPALLKGMPAITLGCLDDLGLTPRSHQPRDTLDAIDPAAVDAAVHFGLLMVDAIDAAVGEFERVKNLHGALHAS